MENYSEFTRYLLEIEDIPKNRIRYYVRWVRKFYHFKTIAPHCTMHLEGFLESLSRNSPPWMVRQAEHAVRLYMIFMHTAENATRKQNKVNHSGS